MNPIALLLMAAPQGGEPGNPLFAFLPFIILLLIMYFLIIRPQSKQRKVTASMQAGLKKGDRVVTSGGIHGIVEGQKDKDTLLIKTAGDTKLHVSRSAVTVKKNTE